MALYWCKCGRKGLNFGDHIGPYLYKKITGKVAKCSQRGDHYLVVGSILHSCNAKSIIWGVGIMFQEKKFRKPKEVHCVRGPITRQCFLKHKYPCPPVYGDPALLLPQFYSPPIIPSISIGIIPHYVDYKVVSELYRDTEILIIDVCQPVEKVIDQILRCEATLSSSLHGIVVSHAYNRPCVWISVSNKIAGKFTKYHDYYQAFNESSLNTLTPKNLTVSPSVSELLMWTKTYPNPKFPITTSHILKACPFMPPHKPDHP